MSVYTAQCDEFGCLWLRSTSDVDQAWDWAEEHEALGNEHKCYVIGERS